MGEGELEALRAAYDAMVEYAPDAITIVDMATGRFTRVNRSATELFRCSREELLQRSPAQLSPEYQPDGRRSDQLAAEYLNRALDGEEHAFEWLHLDSRGEEVPCRVHLTRIPDETRRLVRGSIRDLRTERAALAGQERFREILESTPNMVAMADKDGRILYMNPAIRRALEVTDETWQGTHITDWIAAPEALGAVLEEATTVGVWRGRGALRTRGGLTIPTEHIVLAHKDERGRVAYLSTIATDLTDQLAAQARERRLQQAQRLEGLGLLAGGIAHDFNNILVGILGNAALALDEEDPVARREAIGQIQAAARRAAELAQQMLTYAGKAEPAKEAIDPAALVEDVVALTRGSMRSTVTVEVRQHGPLPALEGDPAQLRQVLMNLLINASDAMPEGGTVEVRLRTGAPDSSTPLFNDLPPDARECVCLEVADSGTGIQGPVEAIFDPFFTTKSSGRGLGLASVVGIVKKHRGAIGVETSARGTTFRLWFPPGTAQTAEEAPEVQTKEWRGEGTILIVDDEDMVRRVLRLSVERLGFEVIEAADGEQALSAFADHHDRLSAVILDRSLPGTSGTEIMQHFRRTDGSVPIVLTSGYANAPGGADAFLPKPFRPTEIASLLQELLARR